MLRTNLIYLQNISNLIILWPCYKTVYRKGTNASIVVMLFFGSAAAVWIIYIDSVIVYKFTKL